MPKDLINLVVMITLSLVIDIDIFLSEHHRELVTHSLIFWGAVILPVIIVLPNYWIIAPPIFFHLFLDTLDWGIMMFFPVSKKKFGLKLLVRKEQEKSIGFGLATGAYLKERRLLYLEGVIMVTSIVLLAMTALCS